MFNWLRPVWANPVCLFSGVELVWTGSDHLFHVELVWDQSELIHCVCCLAWNWFEVVPSLLCGTGLGPVWTNPLCVLPYVELVWNRFEPIHACLPCTTGPDSVRQTLPKLLYQCFVNLWSSHLVICSCLDTMEAKSQFPFQTMVHLSYHFLLMEEIVPVCGPLPLPSVILSYMYLYSRYFKLVGEACSKYYLLGTCLSNKLFTRALARGFLNMVTCWNSIGIIVIRCTLYVSVGSTKDSWWLRVLNMLLVKQCINDLGRVCVSTVPALLVPAMEVCWGLLAQIGSSPLQECGFIQASIH